MVATKTKAHLAATPNLTRYQKLFRRNKDMSILRALQYEVLENTKLKGNVLDFGGGNNAKYHHLIHCKSYESVNIDPAIEPTWVVKIGEPLPCPTDHYDTVLTLNTIEHIYDAKFALKEMHKSLKKDGDFACALPFLYPIHAHPDDYFRPTASWWEKTLTDIGFKDIKITPLLWGPLTTGLICSGMPGPFKNIRKHFALLLDLLYAKLRFGNSHHYNEEVGNLALGYFIIAKKV